MTVWQFLLLLLSIDQAISSITPICQPPPGIYHGPKLPKLPDSFSTRIEANIEGQTTSYSYEVLEYYNKNSNYGGFEFSRHGETWRTIYNYQTDEHIRVNGTSKQCTVEKIEQDKRNPFGFDRPGGHNIGSANDLFKFGGKIKEYFMNTTFIRGIKCYHWKSCINNNRSSFFLDHYFSVPDWRTPSGMVSVPVLTKASGIALNKITNYTQSNETHNFSSSYNFFSFQPGPPNEEHFQTPPGVFCPGHKSQQKTPKMPKEFEVSLEMINQNKTRVSNVREFYDLKERFYRYDHVNRKTNIAERVIQDYNTGLVYRIKKDTYECDIKPLDHSWAGTNDDPEHLLRLKKVDELFHLENDGSHYKYEGHRNVRDISTDVWIGYVNNTRNGTVTTSKYEWHFSKKSWTIHSDISAQNMHQVPIQLRSYFGQNQERLFIVNFFNFDPSEPTSHMLWPVRSCFWDNRHYMYFRLDGDYAKYAHGNEGKVMKGIRSAVSRVGQISTFRVSSLLIFNSSYDNVIAVRLYVLGVPQVKGTPVLSPKHTMPLHISVRLIKRSIKSGKLRVQFPFKGQQTTLKVQRDSYYETDDATVETLTRERSTGFGVGQVVGVTIGVIVIAVFLTLIAIFVLLKRNGVNLFSYMRFK